MEEIDSQVGGKAVVEVMVKVKKEKEEKEEPVHPPCSSGGKGESKSKRRRMRRQELKRREARKQWKVTTDKGEIVKEPIYQFTTYAKEDHNERIYGVDFYFHGGSKQRLFATVALNRVTIYDCPEDDTAVFKIKLLICFADADKTENLYTCAWSKAKDNQPILAAAGVKGVIKIFSPAQNPPICSQSFLAHSADINHLQFHPNDNQLLLSGSKDHSIRLWNTLNEVLIAIFGGSEDSHRDEVLSVDWHLAGNRFLSTGMDHSIKIWKMNSKEMVVSIKLSKKFSLEDKHRFQPRKVYFPDYSTRDVHRNYVDSAKWLGNVIISKSAENEAVIWKPGNFGDNWENILKDCDKASIFRRLPVANLDYWFLKIGYNLIDNILAVGTTSGEIFIYDLFTSKTVTAIKPEVLSHSKCTRSIRQIAFSIDGRTLIAVCSDATIWRWDKEDLWGDGMAVVKKEVKEEPEEPGPEHTQDGVVVKMEPLDDIPEEEEDDNQNDFCLNCGIGEMMLD